MEPRTVLKIENISKSFTLTRAVHDFSFELCSGTIHGLIGENGSGKSTLASIIAGILEPDSGKMFLNNNLYNPKSAYDASEKKVTMVVQEVGTIDGISVASNIFLNKESQFQKLGLINFKKMYKAAEQVLDELGIKHILPNELTSGLNFEDRKLVEIAKALVSKPEILIIDETSNALSSKARKILYEIIETVKTSGGSVLFITHDLNELVDICDLVTIMRDGEYVETLEGSEMDISVMKKLMVGREIYDEYYRKDAILNNANQKNKRPILRASKLFSPELRDISFELYQGEILGIGGLSESGMHELGQLLFGLEKPDSGSVEVYVPEKQEMSLIKNSADAVNKGMGYMSKNRDRESLILELSIKENICLPYLRHFERLGLVSKKREEDHSINLCEQFSIKMESIDQYCNQLSGGNKQKVVFAKWIGCDSDIFIMDCPTRGIDVGVKENIYNLMMELKLEGKSIVMISEELTEIIGMSDRVLILKNGGISVEVKRESNLTEQYLIEYMI